MYWHWNQDLINAFHILSKKKNITNIKFRIVSPETYYYWSYGEIYNTDYFDPNTGKPTVGDLFCSKIFGFKSGTECLCETSEPNEMSCCKKCGMYIGINRWDKRSRFGHINLTISVVHTLFYKIIPNVLSILLNMEMETMKDFVDVNSMW